ncbi:ANTAR domain-containing protein [Embleya sp. NPDC050154]|uniref:ANTAR domain-containing protein n=1 Tax=Embleya sp. NPDC050154 TaxID=3363988 RepID=UPI00378ED1F0
MARRRPRTRPHRGREGAAHGTDASGAVPPTGRAPAPALASRADVDQAKGLPMARYGVDANRAFAILSRTSQERSIKLRTSARELPASVTPTRTDHTPAPP